MKEKELAIYHNTRCRKSREGLAFLREKGFEPTIVDYLKNIPTAEEIKLLLAKLNMPVEDVIRKEERIFKEKYRGKEFNTDEWIQILRDNPKLIQRPIIVSRTKAVIGRPLENINQIL